MKKLSEAKTIVIKVGTSTLTHDSGLINIRKIESLVKVISDIQNDGRKVIVVTSGAVSCGIAKLGLFSKTLTTVQKQAAASVGQCELIDMYDRNFSLYGHKIAQILLTKDAIDSEERRTCASGTIKTLLEYGCIPIVNENDTVSSEQITFGGNDPLAVSVARLAEADLIINMSDVNGLYDSSPRKNPNAKLIYKVEKITDEIKSMAGGAGRGTGGMIAKLDAASTAIKCKIPMIICNGANVEILYDILYDKEFVGTYFGD